MEKYGGIYLRQKKAAQRQAEKKGKVKEERKAK